MFLIKILHKTAPCPNLTLSVSTKKRPHFRVKSPKNAEICPSDMVYTYEMTKKGDPVAGPPLVKVCKTACLTEINGHYYPAVFAGTRFHDA